MSRFWQKCSRLWGPCTSLTVHAVLIACLCVFISLDEIKPDKQLMEVTIVEPEPLARDVLDLLEPPEQDWTPDMGAAGEVLMPFDETTVEAPEISEMHADVPEMNWDTAVPSTLRILMNTGPSDELKQRSGSAFGFGKNVQGDLVGTMYDFKRTASGKERHSEYEKDVARLIENLGRPEELKSICYRVPKPIYLSHLFVPNLPAEVGPKTFDVDGLMEPSQFIIHYTGVVQAPEYGKYRFVGDFDDVLIVMIDGEVVLESVWCDAITGWKPRDYVGEHMSFTGHALTYGSWVQLGLMKSHRIDILVGENPGGAIAGTLMIQQEGRDYQVAKDGRPILPIFTVQPLTEKEQRKLVRNDAKWKFADHHIPMGLRATQYASDESSEDDVKVMIR